MSSSSITEKRLTFYLDATNGLESLDSAARLFEKLPYYFPTLDEAIRAAGIQNPDLVLKDALECAEIAKDDPVIGSLGLTDDEAGAIACYALNGAGEAVAPYAVINSSLTCSRSKESLHATRKLLFLILCGLRKLPRHSPSAGKQFYRAINVRVPTTAKEACGKQCYAEGLTVTWWSLTSTSSSMSPTSAFVENADASTLFVIGGKELWGYDIQQFSLYDEHEVLLEPEARVRVCGVVARGPHLTVNVELQPLTRLVLEEIIPVGGLRGPVATATVSADTAATAVTVPAVTTTIVSPFVKDGALKCSAGHSVDYSYRRKILSKMSPDVGMACLKPLSCNDGSQQHNANAPANSQGVQQIILIPPPLQPQQPQQQKPHQSPCNVQGKCKEPETVEEVVKLLKQSNNTETCEKLLKKLRDMTHNRKRIIFVVFVISFV